MRYRIYLVFYEKWDVYALWRQYLDFHYVRWMSWTMLLEDTLTVVFALLTSDKPVYEANSHYYLSETIFTKLTLHFYFAAFLTLALITWIASTLVKLSFSYFLPSAQFHSGICKIGLVDKCCTSSRKVSKIFSLLFERNTLNGKREY